MLSFYERKLNPSFPAEVIASEIIHPDDIHVTFSGESLIIPPWKQCANLVQISAGWTPSSRHYGSPSYTLSSTLTYSTTRRY